MNCERDYSDFRCSSIEMEFPGNHWNFTEFPRIPRNPRNSPEFPGITRFPWNSPEFRMSGIYDDWQRVTGALANFLNDIID